MIACWWCGAPSTAQCPDEAACMARERASVAALSDADTVN